MKRNLMFVALTIIAGILGGAMSNYIFTARASNAQEAKEHWEVVAAEQFRIVSKDGTTRALMLEGLKGNVSLNFYDMTKKNRLALGLSPEGAPVLKLFEGGSVELMDKEDRVRAKVAILPDGSPSLRLYDETGVVRAALGDINIETQETTRTGSTERRSESSLVLSDKEGKVLWSAP